MVNWKIKGADLNAEELNLLKQLGDKPNSHKGHSLPEI